MTMELLGIFVPKRLDFTRTAVEVVEEPPAPALPPSSSKAAQILAEVAEKARQKPKDEPRAIYGSVSNADVLTEIRTLLARNDEAARIQLHEDDIKFVTKKEGEDSKRVKTLGEFEI